MKTYKIIGFTLWSVANIIITLRLWDYLSVAPLFVAHIIISICCSILFCVDFSSKTMRVFTYILSALMIMLGVIYAVYFRQPIGFISIISSTILIFKYVFCERKKQPNHFVTKVIASVTLVVLLLSMGFGLREFFVSSKTGLVNGLATAWSTMDENFFNELAKDCTTQEEIARKGHDWLEENIEYDYELDLLYQYFNIEKTLQTKMGVCYDYSNLFAAYCRSQGIPCFVIDGQRRDNSSYLHTWNRVYFNNTWWNVDITFDATSDYTYGFRKLDSINAEDPEYIITRVY